MELTDLGLDEWFEQQSTLVQSGQRLARVTAVDRGAFLVRDQDTEAQRRGRLELTVEC